MKSLHKTFDILEFVILQNGVCVTPSDASEALGINLVTCTRIMGELVKRGYLVQVSRKSGYLPGPMVASLGTRRNVYTLLAHSSRKPIAELSRALGVQVNLAVLNQDRRIMLTLHLGGLYLSPWKHFFFTDHWDTATGRLLLAAQDPSTLAELPGFPKISPEQEVILADIRQCGYVRFKQDGLMIIGHWVRVSGYPTAAFGFGVPEERADEAFALSAQTAQQIEQALTADSRAY